jgi:hypothetical protein
MRKICLWFFNPVNRSYRPTNEGFTFLYSVIVRLMMRRSLTTVIIGILFLSITSITPHSSAQVPTASVTIECEPSVNGSNVMIDVEPGSDNYGSAICTVSNPTAYIEKVEIEVTSDVLSYSAPGSIYVSPNSEEEFTLGLSGQTAMRTDTFEILVKATVSELSGLPPVNPASSEASVIAEAIHYGGCSLELVESVSVFAPSDEFFLDIKINNLGNGLDTFDISLDPEYQVSLEDSGFVLSLSTTRVQLSPESPTTVVSLNVKAPSSLSDASTSDGDLLRETFTLIVNLESATGCANSDCNHHSIEPLLILETDDSEVSGAILGIDNDNNTIYLLSASVCVILILLGYIFYQRSSR